MRKMYFMIYINLLILIVAVAGILISRRKPEEWLLKPDKKEHSLYFLYPLAYNILAKTGLYKRMAKKKDMSKYLGVLDNNIKPELACRLFWCKKLSAVIFIFLLFNIISLLSVLSADNPGFLINSKYIKRPAYGEGKTRLELWLKMISDTSEDNINQRSYGPYELELPVNEQAYTEEELEQVFDKAYEYIKSAVLANNSSFDLIYDRLNFIKAIPGTSITVKWLPDNYRLIKPDGTLANEELAADGVWTNVTAVLTYAVNNIKSSRKYSMSFKIMPRQYSEEELLQKELGLQLEQAEETTGEKEYLELPEELTGYRLIWGEELKSSSSTLIILGLIAGVIVWIANDKELDKKLKQRKEQMLIDYPEIINKFTLLINAGMTTKQAWLKIADDYERLVSHKYHGDKRVKRRHAYDEMLLSARELRLGMSEIQVYEQFGRRTGLIQYIKFSMLLNQNLKKGNRSLTQQLIYEADEAFAERKELAIRLGETAGTKLLGPMLLMLLVVLLMIMIPAFMSFRI